MTIGSWKLEFKLESDLELYFFLSLVTTVISRSEWYPRDRGVIHEVVVTDYHAV